jgi:hypothetical protein
MLTSCSKRHIAYSQSLGGCKRARGRKKTRLCSRRWVPESGSFGKRRVGLRRILPPAPVCTVLSSGTLNGLKNTTILTLLMIPKSLGVSVAELLRGLEKRVQELRKRRA